MHNKGWSSRARGQQEGGSGRERTGAGSSSTCDLRRKCESRTHTKQTVLMNETYTQDGTVISRTDIGVLTQRDFEPQRRVCHLKYDADEIDAVGA